MVQKVTSTKGAASVEYGMIVGLVAVTAIGSVMGFGDSIRSAFFTAEATIGQNGSAGSNGASVGPGAPGFDKLNCFIDGDTNFSGSFDGSSQIDCFYLEGGQDDMMWTGSSAVFVDTGDGIDKVTTGPGNDIVHLRGMSDTYSMGVIDTLGGDDTIIQDGGVLPSIDAGDGDDTIRLVLDSYDSKGNSYILHDITSGSGTNTVEVNCAGNFLESVPDIIVPRYMVAGSDTLSVENCAFYIFGAESGSPKRLDMTLSGTAQFVDHSALNSSSGIASASWAGLSITGTQNGDLGLHLPTDAEHMLGDFNIDLDLKSSSSPSGPPRALIVDVQMQDVSLPRSQLLEHTSSVRLNTAPIYAEDNGFGVDGAVILRNPQEWMTAGIEGEGDVNRESNLNVTLSFDKDASQPSVTYSVPSLSSSDGMRLEINTIGSGQCWPMKLIDTTGGEPDIELSCRGYDFIHPAYGENYSFHDQDVPVNAMVDYSLSTYNRLELTYAGSEKFQINFNGAPGKNGTDLKLRRLSIKNMDAPSPDF